MTKRPSKRDAAKGKLPRKKKAVAPHIKAAADRAEARARGEKITKPRVPIDPPVVPIVAPEHYTVKTEEASASKVLGRPTDYDSIYVVQARKLCELGAVDSELAEFFGVSVRTIYRWKLQHEDFCHAMACGKALADDRVERALYQKATGFTYVEQQALKYKVSKDVEDVKVVDVEKYAVPDTQAGLNWLFNRRPEKWRNISRHEHTGKDGGAIEVDHVGDIEQARRVAFALGRALERQRMKVIDGAPG